MQEKLDGKDTVIDECDRLTIRSSHPLTSFIIPT
jgi:hypothetical protein